LQVKKKKQKNLFPPGKCPGGKYYILSLQRTSYFPQPLNIHNTPSTGPTHKD